MVRMKRKVGSAGTSTSEPNDDNDNDGGMIEMHHLITGGSIGTTNNMGSGSGRSSSGGHTIIIKEGGGDTRIWKVITFIVIGILGLIITDMIEIKKTNKSGEYKDGIVKERIDTTDNPLLHYKPINKEEAAIDTATSSEQQQQEQEQEKEQKEEETTKQGGGGGEDDEDDDDTTTTTNLYQYIRRGQPIDEIQQKQLEMKWGTWTFIDPKQNNHQRPTIHTMNELYSNYPNRDVPRNKFPSNSWQLDSNYLHLFLTNSLELINRTQESILSEYGHGVEDEPNIDFMIRSKMFQFDILSVSSQEEQETLLSVLHKAKASTTNNGDSLQRGGWTTLRSWNNLKKRILHSIMTQDSFNFVMGGHSAAAGHGNHFQQSYTLQVAWIMEPIFARLGVKHESRNFGNGGLGTSHNGIGAGSIYGPDVDLLMWDSGMTEREGHLIEMFARQAIMGGIKVPAIWHIPSSISAPLHDLADVDVGMFGTAYSGIPKPETLDELRKVKWAARYIKCGNEINNDQCKGNRYNATCWVPRPDGFVPPKKQEAYPGGRAGWHPGNREHQLQGRTIVWWLLQAIQEVLTEWKSAENYELPDSAWHVTELYDNTRSKVSALDPSSTACNKFVQLNMSYFCTVPFKSRTEFTPRAYADLTNIRTIMPKQMLDNIPPLSKPIYMPPDVFNPYLHPPPGEVDVLNIVENGIDFLPVFDPPYAKDFYNSESTITTTYQTPGKGIYPHFYTGSDGCDGTLNSWCDRGADNSCMLRAHNDGRTGFFMDSLSGWLIVNLPKVKRGYIVIRVESWHFAGENPLTQGWSSINNEGESTRRLRKTYTTPSENSTSTNSIQRKLKKSAPPCETFNFEYIIDDRPAKSLGYDDIQEKRYPYFHMQRVVETVTLLEEPDLWTEERDVQLAMRVTGCQRQKVWSLNNVYWS